MSLSKRTRFEVFKRDGFRCTYCGKRPPEVMLEVDHVTPRCEGGTDDPANLTTACAPCNRGKSGVPLGAVAPAVDEMTLLEGMQEALERAAALRHTTALAEAHREAEDDAIAVLCEWIEEAMGPNRYVSERSLRSFLQKLDMDEMRRAIDSAALGVQKKRLGQSDAWRYFCGVCWSKVREKNARAS